MQQATPWCGGDWIPWRYCHLLSAQKMKFSTKEFYSKCDQIRSLLKNSLVENFIFCAVANPVRWRL